MVRDRNYNKKEIASTDLIIRHLLRTNERCRNDDKWLVYKLHQYIAEKNGINYFMSFELFNKLPAYSTIIRVRSHIQNNEKKYTPTNPEVLRRRGYKKEDFQRIFGRREIKQ